MLYEYCATYLAQRIANSREAIQSAQESANEDTKSSSGDKYETGRAMMQIDIEQNNTQLKESLRLKSQLEKISPETKSDTIQLGSLVVTDQANYYFAISIGGVKLNDRQYFVISPEAPIGKTMIGLRTGESFTFRNRTQRIKQLF